MTGRTAGVAAGLAAVVAFVLVGTRAGPTALGGLGCLAVVWGLLRRCSTTITIGCAGLFAGLLWTGGTSGGAVSAGGLELRADDWALLAGSAAILFAWTVGRTSVELREGLAGTDTLRLEATHVAGTAVLVGGATAIAILPSVLTVYPSSLGLVLVVFGGVTLTTALWLE